MSLTNDIWQEIEKEAADSGGAIPPKHLMKHWNAGHRRVHQVGKIDALIALVEEMQAQGKTSITHIDKRRFGL